MGASDSEVNAMAFSFFLFDFPFYCRLTIFNFPHCLHRVQCWALLHQLLLHCLWLLAVVVAVVAPVFAATAAVVVLSVLLSDASVASNGLPCA